MLKPLAATLHILTDRLIIISSDSPISDHLPARRLPLSIGVPEMHRWLAIIFTWSYSGRLYY